MLEGTEAKTRDGSTRGTPTVAQQRASSRGARRTGNGHKRAGGRTQLDAGAGRRPPLCIVTPVFANWGASRSRYYGRHIEPLAAPLPQGWDGYSWCSHWEEPAATLRRAGRGTATFARGNVWRA